MNAVMKNRLTEGGEVGGNGAALTSDTRTDFSLIQYVL